jgi:hypothetical protein
VARLGFALVSRRAALAVVFAIASAGLFSGHAAAIGIIPGSFSYKIHETVPLRDVEKGLPYFQRVADVKGLFGAPFVGQAGERADMSVLSALSVSSAAAFLDGSEIPRETVTELPPGVIANLGEIHPCSRTEFFDTIAQKPGGCPPESQVGVVSALYGGFLVDRTYPLYKLTAAHGHLAALGFPHELFTQPVGILVNADLRGESDYGITLTMAHLGFTKFVPAPFMTIWGIPAAAIHDRERWNPDTHEWGESLGGPPVPLIANPTDCEAGTLEARTRLRYWIPPSPWLPADPEDPVYRSLTPAPQGCDRLGIEPRAEVLPTSDVPDSPTGIDLRLELPRDPEPAGLEAPPLKSASLTLPEGVTVNPATADGLTGCSPEQIGLEGGEVLASGSIRYSAEEPRCPSAARIGDATIEIALAEAPIEGDIYLATPFRNPFRSPLAFYFVFGGPGFTTKLAAKVEADPASGRLTASIDSLPYLPIETMRLSIFGGPRGPLLTPPGCGEGPSEMRLTPWSAPQSGPPTRTVSPYAHFGAAERGACAHRGSLAGSAVPRFLAGSRDAAAGHSSALVLRLEQSRIGALEIALPRGLNAAVRGVDRCREGDIARAEEREGPGQGLLELSDPSCPSSSRVGSLVLGAGSGPAPLLARGSLYLAGPYDGAPFSLVAIVPALAGDAAGDPLFDLGAVIDRVALDVNRRTGAVRARVGSLSRRVHGIPLRIKSLGVALDRPGFMRNPSDCRTMNFAAGLESGDDAPSVLLSGFRATGCGRLGFAPRLGLTAIRGRGRGQHPTIRAVLRAKPGEAGIAGARVSLPASELLDRDRLRSGCHALPLVPGGCPRSAILGRARAWSALIDGRLEGPVYLRSSSKRPPELVLALAGEPEMEVVGQVRSEGGRVRIELSGLPDAQLTKLDLTLWGGRRGFLANARDLCGPMEAVTARFVAYGGAVEAQKVPLGGGCVEERSGRRARMEKRMEG